MYESEPMLNSSLQNRVHMLITIFKILLFQPIAAKITYIRCGLFAYIFIQTDTIEITFTVILETKRVNYCDLLCVVKNISL